MELQRRPLAQIGRPDDAAESYELAERVRKRTFATSASCWTSASSFASGRLSGENLATPEEPRSSSHLRASRKMRKGRPITGSTPLGRVEKIDPKSYRRYSVANQVQNMKHSETRIGRKFFYIARRHERDKGSPCCNAAGSSGYPVSYGACL